MTKFFIPNLLEYLYGAIAQKSKEFLFDRLNREDFQNIKSRSKIKQFVEKESLEDKLILLSKLNYGCAVVIWDKEKTSKSKMQDVLLSYLEVDEGEIVKTIVRDKIYCVLSTDMIRSMQVISKINNSKVYKINSQYRQSEYEGMKQRNLVSKMEADNNLNWMVSKIDNALSLQPILETSKINVDQFRILLFLQQCGPAGATVTAIRNKVGKKSQSSITYLYSKNMVDFPPDNKTIVFIDTMGLILVEQIISKL